MMKVKIKRRIRELLRLPIDLKNRHRLKNHNCSIFCSNCIGGVIYHNLGLQFMSPTINMYFESNDFIKFLRNPEGYLDKPIKLLEVAEENYPVVQIEDIVLHCVHYHTLQDVERAWNNRAKRIDWSNIRVIMSERDGCTEEDLIAFDQLPYEYKVVFTHKPMPNIKSSVYIPGTDLDGTDGHWVAPLTNYVGKITEKRVIDKWDYVKFLNDGSIK